MKLKEGGVWVRIIHLIIDFSVCIIFKVLLYTSQREKINEYENYHTHTHTACTIASPPASCLLLCYSSSSVGQTRALSTRVSLGWVCDLIEFYHLA